LETVNLLPFHDSYDCVELFGRENELFVKLAILSQEVVNRDWKIHDRRYQFKQLSAAKKNIDMKDILCDDVPLTVVSGIAGIGKSTLVKQIIGGWLREEIWNHFGNFSSSLIVIPVRCRDLNNKKIDEETDILDIICDLHPNLAKLEKTDFQEIGGRTVLLLDGIDELIDVESIASNNIKPTAKLLKDILINNKTFCQWRVLLGRPQTSRIIKNVIVGDLKQNFTGVEICGFDKENARLYIEKFFDKDQVKVKQLLMKIEISQTLSAMSTVPAYLWSICGIYQQLENVPKTYTEILLYNLLIFQKIHWFSKQQQSTATLNKVVNHPNTLSYTKSIAKLAYHALCKRKVVIEIDFHEYKPDLLDDLQKTGLIISYKNRVEFRHLTVQELLAAIHIVLESDMKQKSEMFKNTTLSGCLSFVAGLEGLLWSEEDSLLGGFMKRLQTNIQTPFIDSKEDLLISFLQYGNQIDDEILEYFYEFKTTKESLLTKLKSISGKISINYKGSINLYCVDYILKLLIDHDLKFSFRRFSVDSRLIKYGKHSFIAQLFLDQSPKIHELTFEVKDKNIPQIPGLEKGDIPIDKMVMNIDKITLDGGKANCKSVYDIIQVIN
jgi:Predicted NTPase (NACHT family)